MNIRKFTTHTNRNTRDARYGAAVTRTESNSSFRTVTDQRARMREEVDAIGYRENVRQPGNKVNYVSFVREKLQIRARAKMHGTFP